MLYRQISLFAKIRNQMPKAPIKVSGFAKIKMFKIISLWEDAPHFSKRDFESVGKISLSKINVRNFSDFGKIGDYKPLQDGPKRWSLWPDRNGQRSYHVLPTTSGSRSLHLTSPRWGSFKTKMNRIGWRLE